MEKGKNVSYNTLYMREYRKKYPEKSREISRRWYRNHPERIKIAGEQVKRNRAKYRKIILDHYGHKCACCGEEHENFLIIDHVNGGGSKEFHAFTSTIAYYKWIINHGFPDSYQILCANCNMAKGPLKQRKCPVHLGVVRA